MNDLPKKTVNTNERMWQRVALIAGIFSFIVCLLLIANYIQIKKADPINMNVLNTLVERLNQNPGDTQLRDQIRELDLLARKAYFTSQWQIRAGGYMVLAGLAIMLIAFQVISLKTKKEPIVTTEFSENTTLAQKHARRWIAGLGIVIVALALFFAFLSQNDLNKKFSLAATALQPQNTSENPASSDAGTASADTAITAAPNENNASADTAKIANETDSKDNYPNFRGMGGTGRAAQKNIPVSWNGQSGKNVLWKTAIPLSGYNSPVIWGSKIFLTGASATKREIYCIDKNTGKILWTTPFDKLPSSPGMAPKVSAETGLAASSAATDGKGVYAIFPNGDIIGLDMDGKKLWAQNLGDPQNHYGHASSLMIYKEMVIVQFDQRNSPKLLALSSKTGKTVWSTNRPVKISWASPIIVNTGKRTEIILAAEPYVAAYNPANGQELWKIDCISGEVGPSVTYANGIIFSVNDYSKLTAIKTGEEPKVIWESTDFLSDIPSPVATDKYLFLATSYGTVVCYDAQTGQKYWDKDFGNSIYASPTVAEGKVYLLDKNGTMHVFKADKEYASLGESPLGEKSVCTPAFTTGHIYLRGEKNLYCIGK